MVQHLGHLAALAREYRSRSRDGLRLLQAAARSGIDSFTVRAFRMGNNLLELPIESRARHGRVQGATRVDQGRIQRQGALVLRDGLLPMLGPFGRARLGKGCRKLRRGLHGRELRGGPSDLRIIWLDFACLVQGRVRLLRLVLSDGGVSTRHGTPELIGLDLTGSA